jgi:uncharacterized protein
MDERHRSKKSCEDDMPAFPTDHTGLQILPLDDCLRLVASVPVGRLGFHTDGEMAVLPVNHVVDGQDVIFRTSRGSKLSAAEAESLVVFEADDYDQQTRTGWSVVINGHAEVVYEDADITPFDHLDVRPWPDATERPYWVRIRPVSVTGRRIPACGPATADRPNRADASASAPRIFDVLHGGAGELRSGPFGDVGTMFSGHGIEVVWVSKLGESVDDNWFWSHEEDVILVVQGQLKVEFETPDQPDRVLGIGEALVLPPRMRCRAYRWPRDASQATIFVAAYPAGWNRRQPNRA